MADIDWSGVGYTPGPTGGSHVWVDPQDPQREMEEAQARDAEWQRQQAAYAQQQADAARRAMHPGFLSSLTGGGKLRALNPAPSAQWGYTPGKGVSWMTPTKTPGVNGDWTMTANLPGSAGFGFSGNRI